MSKQRILPMEQSPRSGSRLRAGGRRAQSRTGLPKLAIYGAIAVLGILLIAYIDGGEEPIHPIEQQIALSDIGAGSFNSGDS